jgi:hypothetical protein
MERHELAAAANHSVHHPIDVRVVHSHDAESEPRRGTGRAFAWSEAQGYKGRRGHPGSRRSRRFEHGPPVDLSHENDLVETEA